MTPLDIRVERLSCEKWTAILNQFQDASFYQTSSYGSVMYGDSNIEHVILLKNEDIIAGAQVCIRRFAPLLSGIANVHWGPLWQRRNHPKDISNFITIVDALKNEYAIKRNLLLRLWPNEISSSHCATKEALLNCRFSHNKNELPYRTLILDISSPITDLFKNLEQKWRNQLNKSMKNGLKVHEGSTDSFYKIFLHLLEEMLQRKNFISGVDYQVYREIQNKLPYEHKMRIFICEYDGRPVAASMCSALGNTGIYLLGATGNDGMKLNGSNLLQWHMIQYLKDNGCRYYDLGGIDPDANPGVYRFKCGIAGKIGQDVQHIGQYITFNNYRAALLNKFLIKTKDLRKNMKRIINK